MKLTRLVSTCDDGECPALFLTDRGTLVVQGGRVADHGREIPAHETMVEIPMELIRRAIRDNLI
ncbi:hypothetical protein [Streptomyces sp. NRRL S-378]|uniref:hypothetical protein n=1 Tax=Streptomyces sp. NRRL S-378 TaxID=1463904 RepID=UPI00099C2C3F|nr:hypothetical protein [Streptomyces sp. NRRL S-378]